jgi:hypothetical protein
MRKYYIINKITGTMAVLDNAKDVGIYIWGRHMSNTILIVSNDYGDCVIPLFMTSGDLSDVVKLLECFYDNQ